MKKLIDSFAYSHAPWEVFSDFVEMSAISLANAVNVFDCEDREKRYHDIIKKYKPEELEKFPQLFAMLVDRFEHETTDHLGALFHELELHNKYKGQYFTPYPLCKMLAKLTLGDPAKAIEAKGFVTASEPCCGSGAMIIALADSMRESGVNYQQTLHVTAVDLDIRCVHMAYIQFTLMHIPAVVVHGNSLALEEFSRWHTLAHNLGFWDGKLRRGRTIDKDAPPPPKELHKHVPMVQPADIQMDMFSTG